MAKTCTGPMLTAPRGHRHIPAGIYGRRDSEGLGGEVERNASADGAADGLYGCVIVSGRLAVRARAVVDIKEQLSG